MTDMVKDLGDMALGAAIGFGTFVGYTRANIRTIKEILNRIETKMDRASERLARHETLLQTRPCLTTKENSNECAETKGKDGEPVK